MKHSRLRLAVQRVLPNNLHISAYAVRPSIVHPFGHWSSIDEAGNVRGSGSAEGNIAGFRYRAIPGKLLLTVTPDHVSRN